MPRVMICGEDCQQGDQHCNGYCQGKNPVPPLLTQGAKQEIAKAKANQLLYQAERAWYEYASLIDVGPERILAFDIYENVRRARIVK